MNKYFEENDLISRDILFGCKVHEILLKKKMQFLFLLLLHNLFSFLLHITHL